MRTRDIRACLAAFVLYFSVSVAATAKVICVDNDAIGANDGSSWVDAYNHLQDALADANSATKPVEIRVAGGVHRPDEGAALTPSDRKATFQLINGVTIRGGYAGFGEPDPNVRDIEAYETILSGDIGAIGDNSDNSFHVVTGSGTDETAILDGFTSTAGNANGTGLDACGGGTFNGPGASPTLTNCIVSGNSAASHGAGMYNDSNCVLRLSKCTFSSNSAVSYGGGMYNGNGCSGTLTDCTFTENSANYGGGMRNNRSNPTLTNCTFSENSANYAAGMNNADASNATLTNCTFSGNSADMDGGGMLNSYSSPLVMNCTFSNNSARGNGAGMYNYFEFSDPLVKNCIFRGNFAEGDGGATYNRNDTRPRFISCLFTGNSSPNGNAVACDSHGGGHLYPNAVKLTNCILWEGGNEVWIGDDSIVWITYSVIPGGWPDGQENWDVDPRLTADGHLRADSPCIGLGDPAYVPAPGETDIDGESRAYARVDIGPDEFIDSDWDGLPDWWEQKYFASPTAGNPNGNPDGDGLDNLAEYEASRNPLLAPRNYYVDPVEGSDEWDGLSAAWDGTHGPKGTIQGAIDTVVQYEGDTVILTTGTYTGRGNRDINYRDKVVTVRSANPDDPAVVAATIIDCQGTPGAPHRGFNFHYGEGPSSAVIGLTISNGYYWGGGGGIYCRYSSPTISKNVIRDNTAAGDGGGIYCCDCSPIIVENTITRNRADDDGGGICCRDAAATISKNIIMENVSPDNGGGIFCRNLPPTITNNIITGNRAEDGGGIWCRDSWPEIANNTITGNVAADTAGGVGGRGSLVPETATVTNSILWGNTAVNGCEIGLIRGAALTVSYSDVQSGPLAFYLEEDCTLDRAGGNIDADPCFARPGYWDANGTPNDPNDDLWVCGDYHLKSQGWRWDRVRERWDYDEVTSRCIDAGNPGAPLSEELLFVPDDPNNEWGQNLRIDMGAYGGRAEASMPPHDWALLADLTNNGAVDFEDFAGQANDRLESEGEQPGDLNRNGTVDMGDLALLAEDWLKQTSWYEP
jgi:predicted outer membrane repeat protein